jgi:hypothetical protein
MKELIIQPESYLNIEAQLWVWNMRHAWKTDPGRAQTLVMGCFIFSRILGEHTFQAPLNKGCMFPDQSYVVSFTQDLYHKCLVTMHSFFHPDMKF